VQGNNDQRQFWRCVSRLAAGRRIVASRFPCPFTATSFKASAGPFFSTTVRIPVHPHLRRPHAMRLHQAAIPALAMAAGTCAASESTDKRTPFSYASRASAHLARAHGFALKHSAALARDLRTTFRSVLPARAPPSDGIHPRDSSQAVLDEGHKLFCTVPKSGASPASNKNGTDPGHGNSTSSKVNGATSTKSSGSSQTGTASAPSATSSWKVFHTYVSCQPCSRTKLGTNHLTVRQRFLQ
jgi:hypothetical protein